MYVSVRRYEMDAETVDELMRRVEEGFVPIISNAPGFIAYYALDAGGGGSSFNQYLHRSSGGGRIQQDGSRLCKGEFGRASPISA